MTIVWKRSAINAAGKRGRARAKLAAGWNQAARAIPSLARVRWLERPIITETERERTGNAPRTTSEKASPAPQAWPSFAQPHRRSHACRCKPPDRFRFCQRDSRRLSGLAVSILLDDAHASGWPTVVIAAAIHHCGGAASKPGPFRPGFTAPSTFE